MNLRELREFEAFELGVKSGFGMALDLMAQMTGMARPDTERLEMLMRQIPQEAIAMVWKECQKAITGAHLMGELDSWAPPKKEEGA